MTARGFSLIELLIALTMMLVIAGTLAGVVPSARESFDRIPADLELQQRGRTAIDTLSRALRSAGRDVVATNRLGSLSDLLPAVWLSEPDGSGAFTTLSVILPVTEPAQGVLSAEQLGTGAGFTLEDTACPGVGEVCGFVAGMTAMVADGLGHFDLFEVENAVAALRMLTPSRALSRSYPAGAVVVEVEELRFSLARQPDESFTLVRETAAGAIQPIVDFVSDLAFRAVGRDAAAGFYQPREVDVSLTVQAPTPALRRVLAGRVFRTSIRLRNAP